MKHREIIYNLDYASTDDGPRIMELVLIELLDKIPTGLCFHSFFNPGGEMEDQQLGGTENLSFLRDMPTFLERSSVLLKFIGQDSLLIGHSVEYRLQLLTSEFARNNLTMINKDRFIDTKDLMPTECGVFTSLLPECLAYFGVEEFEIGDRSWYSKPFYTMEYAQRIAQLYRLIEPSKAEN